MSSPHAKRDLLDRYVALAPAIPVVTVDDPDRAVPLARTLVEAGLPVIEVTLRTPSALLAIERIARDVPGAVVGAGTVLGAEQIASAEAAGARFLVSPGTSPRLASLLAESGLPALPGCATASEAVALQEAGFDIVKFFPAMASGGAAWLKNVAAPLPNLRFCPTGGVDLAGARTLLALPNVVCVGGAWMAPPDAITAADWTRIGALAREAAALKRRNAAS